MKILGVIWRVRAIFVLSVDYYAKMILIRFLFRSMFWYLRWNWDFYDY